MFITVAGVLDAEALERVREKAARLEWRDGAQTAGASARAVKRNEQADLSSGPGAGLHAFLLGKIRLHRVIQSFARPRTISRLLLSRTGEGGGYGPHVDNAMMGGMRSDLSFTLFLSDPGDYDGGALRLQTEAGAYAAKPVSGDLVLYPSGAVHEVEAVTRGERLACVGWIESRVRRADQRTVLFDLETARASLPNDASESLVLDKAISNLLRMWAET